MENILRCPGEEVTMSTALGTPPGHTTPDLIALFSSSTTTAVLGQELEPPAPPAQPRHGAEGGGESSPQ